MEALRALLTSLAPLASYVLIGLAVLALLLVLLLVFLAFRARRRARLKAQREAAQAAVAQQQAQAEQQASADAAPQDGVPQGALKEEPEPRSRWAFTGIRAPGGLRRSFRRAVRLLKHNVSGRDYLYQTPWLLLFGQQGSGKSTMMRNSGLNLPLGRPEADARQRPAACNWWFFDSGVVLDVDGRYILDANGANSDESGWYGLLRLLQWHRPRRPLDGVIVTIPATDLVGPDALSPQRLESNATAFYHKLWEAQKRLGLRLPVYVVVTKCDAIEGFGALAGELPQRLREQMFGWSSPYSLGSAYAPRWLDEAGAAIDRDLLLLEADVLAQGSRVSEPGEILMLHSRFGEISRPLRTYIDELFKDTAYHEAFLFRGLYFVGDTLSPADRANVIAGPASWEPRPAGDGEQGTYAPVPGEDSGLPEPVFVRQILEHKAFPEHGLARPTSRRLAYQSRVVRIAQGAVAATAVLGAIGLAFAYSSISDSADRMRPFVEATAQDLSDLERQRRDVIERQEEIDLTISALREAGVTPDELPQRPRLEIDREFFTQSAQRLLEGSTGIDDEVFASWLVPTSWFSELDENVRETFGLAYERIVLRSMHVQLNQKAAELMEPAAVTPVTFDMDGEIRFALETPEYALIKDFVDQVGTLETHVRYYNGLPSASTVDRLDDLALFSFGIALPQVFEDKAKDFTIGRKEGDFEPFHVAAYRREAQRKLLRLDEAAASRLFEGNVLLDRLNQLRSGLEALRTLEERAGRGNLGALTLDDQLATLRRLHASIRAASSALSRPELAWVSREQFSLGSEHVQLMTAIGGSAFFGEAVRKEITRRNQERFERLKARLTDVSTGFTGPLLTRGGGQAQLQLAPLIEAMDRALESFLGQSFLQTSSAEGGFAKAVPGGRRLVWDNKVLEEALRVGESFDIFLNFEVKEYPKSLQNGLRALAFAKLEQHMAGLIGRAQSYSRVETVGTEGLGEQQLAADIDRFETSAELLLQLHESLDHLRLSRVSGDFKRLVIDQATSLLISVDLLLDLDELYLPRKQLGEWTGSGPMNLRAYGVRDRTELGAYLALQRRRVEYLAYDLARPMVEFLGQRRYETVGGDLGALFRWRRILLQLEGYQTARAGNSVAVLEQFVLNELAEVSGENCLNLLPYSNEESGDFFLQRRMQVSQQVLARCSGLTDQVVRRLYRQLEGEFNQHLAGRFPFLEGRPDKEAPDASIAEVREFFRLYDRAIASNESFLEKVRELYGGDAAATRFLGRLAGVRGFFAPWLGQAVNAGGPYYDYEVDFRVNRNAESGGNQIIDWRLRTGAVEIAQLDEKKKGRWNAGEPVVLSLRWAKGSAYAPVQDGRREDMTVAGRLASFTYEGNWSLLRLLASNRSNGKDFRDQGDVDPNTLALVVPLRPDGRPQEGQRQPIGATDPARVFVRIRLTPPPGADGEGKATPLRMPIFPARAPELVVAANVAKDKR